MRWIAALLVAASSVLAGLADSFPVVPAIGAASALDEKIAALDNLVLRERISRYSQRGSKIRKLESFDSVINTGGNTPEDNKANDADYSETRRRNTDSSGVGKIVGVWSFGEAITMLRTTRDALAGRSLTPGDIGFRFPASERRWFVTVGSATYWLDFEGVLRVSAVTGDIERISWTAVSIPREAAIARIEWSLDFARIEIGHKICTIPKTGIYRILRTGTENRAEWNVTEFSEVGRYGSESVIRFEP